MDRLKWRGLHLWVAIRFSKAMLLQVASCQQIWFNYIAGFSWWFQTVFAYVLHIFNQIWDVTWFFSWFFHVLRGWYLQPMCFFNFFWGLQQSCCMPSASWGKKQDFGALERHIRSSVPALADALQLGFCPLFCHVLSMVLSCVIIPHENIDRFDCVCVWLWWMQVYCDLAFVNTW